MLSPLLTAAAAAAALAAGVGSAVAAPAPVSAPVPIASHPHDAAAYTQGLVWHRGRVFESTGLYGASSVREVALRTGRVLRRRDLSPSYFGEGLALSGNRLVQLTWRERTAFVWSRDTFAAAGRFRYAGEGWGLATLPKRLVMSDGTATLRFLDPATFRVVRRVRVTDDGVPVTRLNELEVVRGRVWANIWQRDDIVVINPGNGRVEARLDLSGAAGPRCSTASPGTAPATASW